jgi:hypothetical protein
LPFVEQRREQKVYSGSSVGVLLPFKLKKCPISCIPQ